METTRVQHIKTGKCYRTIGACKVQINGEWVPGVAYVFNDNRPEYNKESWGEVYVRSEKEFLTAFRPLSYQEWSDITESIQSGSYGHYVLEPYSLPLPEPADY